ncbi:MAG: VWA containing CoxE family protein [Chloroflexi bacterium]|nr:VWA containing CoxE family protein [Chloroflexota bacterium]
MLSSPIVHRRQVVYWRLLSAMFGYTEQAGNFETMALEITREVDLPEYILDPRISIDALLHHYPELEIEFTLEIPPNEPETATLRRGLIFSKLLLNAFGPNTQTNPCTANQYAQWLKDVEHLERALNCPRGSLRGNAPLPGTGKGQGNGAGGDSTTPDGGGGGAGMGIGSGFNIPLEEIQRAIKGLENDLIKRMALRELLQDNRLAAQMQPSMALVEQLLRDKANLSGNALKNAKRLIRQYVDELAEVLRLQVKQTPSGKIDRSVPPKRVFRNLDLKRTIWKNLTNWNEEDKRLYVDRLYYKHTGRKRLPTRLIVVVDQSGSMVDAMVQCTILASIFAGLPDVDVHLLAFDTRVLDLTPWVGDPFEVLMRTQLGGGTHIRYALQQATEKIQDPRRTALVLITDFYEGGSNQELLDTIRALKESKVHFIPVGSVNSSGYASVNDWFRTRLKDMGLPVLTGSPKKLIAELKKLIVA